MMNGIRNIIFDLGGVIFNVDYNLTLMAFQQFGAKDFDKIYTQLKQTPLFDDFETGKINPGVFRDRLRKELGINLSDEQIDAAWNAMLLGLPKERLELVTKLSAKYRLFLLSNTNAIHLPKVNEIIFNSLKIPEWDSIFEQTYYSHLVGMRKPNSEVYEMIVQQHGLKKEETLFIDDSPQHIEGARKIGLQTQPITKAKGIMDLFRQAVV